MCASIYGMNFKHMPELDFEFGYPLAIVVMLLAAVLPYFFFRWEVVVGEHGRLARRGCEIR